MYRYIPTGLGRQEWTVFVLINRKRFKALAVLLCSVSSPTPRGDFYHKHVVLKFWLQQMNNIKKPHQSLVHESLTSETHTSWNLNWLVAATLMKSRAMNQDKERQFFQLHIIINYYCFRTGNVVLVLVDGTASHTHTQVNVSIPYAQPRHTCTVWGHMIGGLYNIVTISRIKKRKNNHFYL